MARTVAVGAEIHVAFVHDFLPSYRHALLRELAAIAGMRLTTIASDPSVSEGFDRIEAGSGYELRIVKRRVFGLAGRPIVVLPELGRELAQSVPDVVITTGNWNFVSNIIVFAYCLRRRIPILVLRHGDDYQELGRVARKVRMLLGRLRDRRLASGVILYTHHEARLWRRTAPASVLGYLNNTVEAAERTKRTRPVASRRGHFVAIGRLSLGKGFEHAISALGQLRLSDRSASLTIIGDGPHRSALEAHARECGAEVYFVGALYEEGAIAQVLQDAVAVVHPGRVGLSIVHAFAYGVPFVTCARSDHGPEFSYLRDRCNGIICGSNNPSAIASALAFLSNNSPEVDKLRRNAWRTARALSMTSAAQRVACAAREAVFGKQD